MTARLEAAAKRSPGGRPKGGLESQAQNGEIAMEVGSSGGEAPRTKMRHLLQVTPTNARNVNIREDGGAKNLSIDSPLLTRNPKVPCFPKSRTW